MLSTLQNVDVIVNFYLAIAGDLRPRAAGDIGERCRRDKSREPAISKATMARDRPTGSSYMPGRSIFKPTKPSTRADPLAR
jgi:hypothetical protein